MSYRLAMNEHRNIVCEIARGEQEVAFVWLNGAIIVDTLPKRTFDQEYFLEPQAARYGAIEQTPRHFARHFLGLKHYEITEGAAAALCDIMALSVKEPRGNHTTLLVGDDGKLIGAYELPTDAQTVARHVGGMVIETAEQLATLTEVQITALAQMVAPKLKPNQKQFLKGVFEMATKSDKPAKPKVKAADKVKKQRAAKGDGPIAQIRKYIEDHATAFRNKTLTRVEAVDALKAKGINKGTIGVQLGKILKELKINAEKGSRAKAKGNGSAKAKAKGKKAAKKAAKKEKRASKKKAAAAAAEPSAPATTS